MKRREIYYVSIPFATGCEIQKNRPAVIVSNDLVNEKGNLVTVVYLSTSDKRPDIRSHVPVWCSGKSATALVEQMESVDKSRIESYVGMCSEGEMQAIEEAIQWHTGIPHGAATPCHCGSAAMEKNELPKKVERATIERDLLMDLVCKAMGK